MFVRTDGCNTVSVWLSVTCSWGIHLSRSLCPYLQAGCSSLPFLGGGWQAMADIFLQSVQINGFKEAMKTKEKKNVTDWKSPMFMTKPHAHDRNFL